MADKRGEKHGNGDHLRGKNRLGDQTGLLQEAGGGPLHGLTEQQPGKHSRKQKQGVVLGHFRRGKRLSHANLEYEPPAYEQNEGMNQAPDPANHGSDETLLEVPAYQLE